MRQTSVKYLVGEKRKRCDVKNICRRTNLNRAIKHKLDRMRKGAKRRAHTVSFLEE